MLKMTRRDFTSLSVAALPALAIAPALNAFAAPARNRSLIGGVQFALQPFCYHDLPMTPENRGTLINRLVANGFGMVELHATWVEPQFTAPGVTADDARERLRAWRLANQVDHYLRVKREFDAAGLAI